MSNVKAPPAWLTGSITERIHVSLDEMERRTREAAVRRHAAESEAAAHRLSVLGLTLGEIVTIERIAAVKAIRADECACEMIRAAVEAIKGGLGC